MRTLFYRLAPTFVEIFRGRNFFFHVLACALTAFCAYFGVDWWYSQNTSHPLVIRFVLPAIIAGGILPILVPLILLAVGYIQKNADMRNSAFAFGQAAMLGSLISSCYKAITGRVAPPFETFAQYDTSREFFFGFLERGIFWGWPSSHTTIAFAMAGVVHVLYRRNRPMVASAWAYALYVGLGVSVSIHWFSDFVAGAILGILIGLAVGKSFLSQITAAK